MRALLVGVNVNNDPNFEYSIKELENLIQALDIVHVQTITQNVKIINEKYYVGKGMLERIKDLISSIDVDVVIFDNELDPSKTMNINEFLNIPIYDRTYLILEIFEKRARSKTSKMQVEIAKLRYKLPRLKTNLSGMSRQGGGAFNNKGSGETKLELSRREIFNKITRLEREIEKDLKNQEITHRLREKNQIKKVALVGYTNAGKSTMMNAFLEISNAKESKKVLQKDMLFASLDTATRLISLPNKREILLTDTVGFINNLPTHLIKAFNSTLMEALDADLVLIVLDATSTNLSLETKVTLTTLQNLSFNKPYLFVLNKKDLLAPNVIINRDDAILLSAKSKENFDSLIKLINDNLFPTLKEYYLTIPYEDSNVYYNLRRNYEISLDIQDNDGYFLKVALTNDEVSKYQKYLTESEDYDETIY